MERCDKISNFYLCDMCAIYHRESVRLCDLTVGVGDGKKKVMVDHGYGRGYDEPTSVCKDFEPREEKHED